MAVFSVIIADQDVGRVVNALCANYNYPVNIPNPNYDPDIPEDPIHNPETIPNTESTNQFANRMTRDFLINHTTAYELRLEKEAVPKPTPPDIQDDD
tara:strand:- start:199 stop:489 length:291 start_codon:yes stop_codon:yes gene_type:complete